MTQTMQVRQEKCKTCIFAVKYPTETRRRIFADVARSDGHITCHQYSGEDEETGEEIDSTVMCRGWYDRDPYHNPYMRMSATFGAVEYVDDAGDPVACPIPQTRAMARYRPTD